MVGVYFFKPVVFEVVSELKPSWRGELEVTDALQLMLEGGLRLAMASWTGGLTQGERTTYSTRTRGGMKIYESHNG